jgi:hypothetical protein
MRPSRSWVESTNACHAPLAEELDGSIRPVDVDPKQMTVDPEEASILSLRGVQRRSPESW